MKTLGSAGEIRGLPQAAHRADSKRRPKPAFVSRRIIAVDTLG